MTSAVKGLELPTKVKASHGAQRPAARHKSNSHEERSVALTESKCKFCGGQANVTRTGIQSCNKRTGVLNFAMNCKCQGVHVRRTPGTHAETIMPTI